MKSIQITTPVGTAKYPRLNEPDTKFKEAGEYSVKLLLDFDTAEPLIKQIDEYYDAAYAEALKEAQEDKPKLKTIKVCPDGKPYRREEDRETGEETGNVEFKFTMRASGVSKKTGKAWSRSPMLFDAKRNPTTANIWGGSEIRVSADLFPWNTALGFGCSLRLIGVQVLKLVSGTSRDPKDMGFEVEEGFEQEADGSEAFAPDKEGDDAEGDF